MKIKKLNSNKIITKRDVVEKVNEIIDYIDESNKPEPKYKIGDMVKCIVRDDLNDILEKHFNYVGKVWKIDYKEGSYIYKILRCETHYRTFYEVKEEDILGKKEPKRFQSEYKVGDYVEVYCADRSHTFKGTVYTILDNGQYQILTDHDGLFGCIEEEAIIGYANKESEYKVGDYVEFYKYFYDVKVGTEKGKIISIHEKPYDSTDEDVYDIKANDGCTITDVDESDIIGYAKPEPKYKRGDYVEYKFDNENKIYKAKLTNYDKDNNWFAVQVGENLHLIQPSDIIGYAKPDLLTQEEKEYLSAVIKPFKDKVTSICKVSFGKHTAFIAISFRNFNGAGLPSFNRNVMYKGMELDRKYTLEELGL